MRLPKTLPPRIPIILAAISLSASKGDQTATTQILSETFSNAEDDLFLRNLSKQKGYIANHLQSAEFEA